MHTQYASGEHPSRRGLAVKQQQPIQGQIKKKPTRGTGKNGGCGMKLQAEIDRFRQQIEKCHADDGTCAEAQDQVQFVAQFAALTSHRAAY